jgi:hypothetical protein
MPAPQQSPRDPYVGILKVAVWASVILSAVALGLLVALFYWLTH